MDAMPAFFVLAAFGAQAVAELLSKRRKVFVASLILVFVIGHELFISWRLFPYESNYYNFLIGGSKNVAQKMLFDIGPSTAVKEAIEFINKDSAGAPTLIYPCLMGHLERFYMAPNVKLTMAPERANYTLVPNSFSWFEGAMVFWRNLQAPAYVVRRDGGDFFYVFKYKAAFGWRCGWETDSNYTYE
jgi:hypothetical protein